MQGIFEEKLLSLAKNCPAPLYAVGGCVRDFLSGLHAKKRDVDLCAPLSTEQFVHAAEQCGFAVRAVYKHTGTVKLTSGSGEDYEFTSFRSDKYVRGVHTPTEIFFTTDIAADAKRRDFTANAVYYDIAAGTFLDPLGGIDDIKARRLKTVDRPEKVFGEDGLRLMRLARQAGQTGFTPSEECLRGASENAALIRDISAERILAETNAILTADEKYDNPRGHYDGLKILDRTGVFREIFPELALGKGMAQRADFHDHDVLEHSLRAVLYAAPAVRWAAILHDAGKPHCMLRDGNAFAHPEEGERIAGEILARLKFPKAETRRVQALVKWHMYDFNCMTKENKLRRFFAEHAEILSDLLDLKQADYSACKDDLSPCPTAVRWKNVLSKMKEEGAPLSLKELRVKGNELIEAGLAPNAVSDALKRLLLHAATFPEENEKERLIALARSWFCVGK